MLDVSLPIDASVIKAIETPYAGYRFRSRLEARWAVFFDALGWSWKYEHEGYQIGYAEKRAWLPDFELTVGGHEYYVEVKGDPNFFADGEWLDQFDFDGGPPDFYLSGHSNSLRKPLILLGNIPKEKTGRLFVRLVAQYKGIVFDWVEVTPDGFGPTKEWDCSSAIANFQPRIHIRPRWHDPVLEALRAARSARFEHGEKP